MQHYLGVARDMGISEEEIGAIEAIVMAVSAGKIMMQLNEVRSRRETTTKTVTLSPIPAG
ncbi:hypothetical protein [Syntrophus gentianae]|uniref:hypothetical protein n=1 Tax=Syntrophus gentianae TaxID=43775 RepID=UPI000B8782D0|nr:hypothetical protein [Syntrophus gentianae]